MVFFYTARNREGKLVRGSIEAISAQAARQALQSSDLEAEELHEATLQERKALEEGRTDFPDLHLRPNLVLEGEEDAAGSQSADTQENAPEAKKSSAEKPEPKPKKQRKPRKQKRYYPFLDTLRLYAGWLLTWYALVYALGGYQHIRELPFRIPYVEALLPPYSPIVLTFTLATFLFLLFTSLYRTAGGGRLKGLALSAAGIAAFVLYTLNVQAV